MGGRYGSALQAAAATGSLEIVHRLLEEKANPNAQGGCYGSALRAASTRGHVEIVKALLLGGADINYNEKLRDAMLRVYSLRKTMTSKTPSKGSKYLAKIHKSSSILEEALGIKANLARRYTKDASAQETLFFALHHILSRGKSISLRSGIHAEADEQDYEILIRGLFYGSSLQAAAAEGHDEVVDVLISHGADVNVQGGIFETALQAAAAENEGKVLYILLGLSDIDIYQRGGAFGSAYDAAIREGHADIIRELRKPAAKDKSC